MHAFKTIGLIGRQRKENIGDTLSLLYQLLTKNHFKVIADTETAQHMENIKVDVFPREQLGAHCDLIIVVGGDGSLLNAAPAAIKNNTAILGINRGKLGFLTDITPTELSEKVLDVLHGKYIEENRFLLNAKVKQKNKLIAEDVALNDIVIMPGDLAHMIEFSIYIDDQFVSSQRADGLIVATPTGSTAYALSGGGPILHPQLNAVVLVPMFPHTLSARPIVISGDSKIKIHIEPTNETTPRLSCDGKTRIPLDIGSDVYIDKNAKQLRLIHPEDYSYFQTLRSKLHWNTKL